MVALRLAVVPADDSNTPARWITRKLRKVERFQFLEYLTRQLAWSHPRSRPAGIRVADRQASPATANSI